MCLNWHHTHSHGPHMRFKMHPMFIQAQFVNCPLCPLPERVHSLLLRSVRLPRRKRWLKDKYSCLLLLPPALPLGLSFVRSAALTRLHRFRDGASLSAGVTLCTVAAFRCDLPPLHHITSALYVRLWSNRRKKCANFFLLNAKSPVL